MAQAGPSGLSQRRRPGGALAGGTVDEDFGGSRPASPATPPPNSTASLKHRTTGGASSNDQALDASRAGVSGTGHHRIAYDPRDLKDEDEESRHPRLTLMEECLLLGLKDRQGYLSFWNDSISYSLRGCILLELLMRRRVAVVKDPRRMGSDVQDRFIEVISGKMTGEVLLDEALKLIKGSEEKRSIAEWIDLLSGETWNLSKIGYQLKQVRERLAKGLVDKGILRTEKRNFLLFDMATHPIADSSAKKETLHRVHSLICGPSTSRLPKLYPGDSVSIPTTRALCLVCCAFAARVLDNALLHLTYEGREATFEKIEEWLTIFGKWPMAGQFGGGITSSSTTGGGGGTAAAIPTSLSSSSSSRAANGSRSASRQANAQNGGGVRLAEGSILPPSDGLGGGAGPGGVAGQSLEPSAIGLMTNELVKEMRAESLTVPDGMFEGIAAVLAVLATMDDLL